MKLKAKMKLYSIDWTILIGFFLISLGIGLIASKRAKEGFSEFFLSGRSMPWWLLGVSMVATTFSADTPNLVSDIVRKNGIAGNWVWWAFLLTGMLTTFIYARLWRKSGIATDLEFYELRYSGKGAKFLRIFRAIYLGVFFNSMIMATVLLAGIKLGAVFLGLGAFESIGFISLITLVYSVLGGFRGVILTDFFQFILAMTGAIYAANYAIDASGVSSLGELLQRPEVKELSNFVPKDGDLLFTLFIIPLAVQWWSVWYPGSEPGGGGYIAQRILASKTERDAMRSSLFFNLAHYALRPWPWIIVALASIVIFPDLESLQRAFPEIPAAMINDDMAYPAMLSLLPKGWAGLVLASLIAALMSTLSTHLNWGSSYLVLDVYKRFIYPEASETKLVWVGRLSIVVLMLLATILALALSHALEAFNILLQIGAGTGLIFILRWFWWRINAWSEITAMFVSFFFALYFQFIHTNLGFDPFSTTEQLLIGIIGTSIAWIGVAMLSKPTDDKVLQNFVEKIKPGGPGWKRFENSGSSWTVPKGILRMLMGALSIYSLLFGFGMVLFSERIQGAILLILGLSIFIWLWRSLARDSEIQ